MRILGVIVAFVAIIAGIGLYRGWFRVASNNADTKSEFTLTVDNDKVLVDRKAATEKMADLGQQAKDSIAGPGGKTENATTVSNQIDSKATAENVQDLGNQAKADGSDSIEKIHEGTVVSVGDELKMVDTEGNEHTHTVAADVNVTCDGKACKATDLRPGMKIRVTTERANPQMVTRIEALDQNDEFQKIG